jgi:flagellin
MTNDVVLGSALRTNLLSLQRTQQGIDRTQNILSTGLRVNSALDNPQSFFAAQSLNNRASDLTRLLDGLGQSISTIQAADKGTEALTSLLNQADSIAQTARDALAGAIPEAKVTGNVDLTDLDLVADAGFTDGNTFQIATVDSDGDRIVSSTITVSAGDTAESLAATITNDFADNFDGEVTARVNDNGQLEITGEDGQAYRIIGADGTNTATAADFASIGLSQVIAETGSGDTALTVNSGNTLTSVQLFEASGNVAEAGDLIDGLIDASDSQIGTTAGGAISFNITLDDGTLVNDPGPSIEIADTTGLTIQGLVDAINNDVNNDGYIAASFDENTGQFSIASTDATVRTISVDTDAGEQLDFGFGADELDVRAAAGTF